MGMRGAGMALLVVATLASLSPRPSATARLHHGVSHLRREEALTRLQEALQLPGVTAEARLRGGGERALRDAAPDFMVELQRRIAHPDGVLRSKAAPDRVLPYRARIVRSFIEQEPAENHLLRFNFSLPNVHERVLGAEVRIYRLRRPRAPLLLHMYQVEEGRPTDAAASADQHRLLGVHAVRAGAAPAWHVFNVLPAVRAWHAGAAANLGLLVTATSLSGAHLRGPASLVARRGARHAPARQPLLVVYTTEAHASSAAEEPSQHLRDPDSAPSWNAKDEDDVDEYSEDDYSEVERGEEDEGAVQHSRRRRESVEANVTSPDCVRRDLYVDFADIGWDSWIIAPQGYNAFQCVGHCPYPLGPVNQPTNHATVQSIMHQIRPQETVSAPCCSPLQLLGLSIMFADESTGEIVLKVYEDMVAATCGCQ